MKDFLSNKKSKIMNWISIQVVKLRNIIKDHKYISTLIVTLLFIGVIGFIVYASNNNIEVESLTVTPNSNTEALQLNEAYSFSLKDYKLSYSLINNSNLSNGSIKIIAEVTSDVDVEWVETVSQKVSTKLLEENDVKNPKKLIVSINNLDFSEKSSIADEVILTLNIKNVKENEYIKYKFMVEGSEETLFESSDNCINDSSCTIVKNKKTIDLDFDVLAGKPYSENKEINYRNIPFGIISGIKKEKLSAINEEGLEGYYFNNKLSDIKYQFSNISNHGNVELFNEKEYYGPFNNISNLPLFNDVYSNILTNNNSSKNGKFEILNSTSEKKCNSVSNLSLESYDASKLEGINVIYLVTGYEYTDNANEKIISIYNVNDDAKENNLIETIRPRGSDGETLNNVLLFEEGSEGNYEITYEVSSDNVNILYKRIFIVREKSNFSDEYFYYNYSENTDALESCIDDSYCKVFSLPDNYRSLEQLNDDNEITEKQFGNSGYVVVRYDSGLTGDLVYKSDEIYFLSKTKLFNININENCELNYNDQQISADKIKDLSETENENSYEYKFKSEEADKIEFAIKYGYQEIPGNSNINLSDIKISLPTKYDEVSKKIILDEEKLLEYRKESVDGYNSIIPIASFYVTAKSDNNYTTGDLYNDIKLTLSKQDIDVYAISRDYNPEDNYNFKVLPSIKIENLEEQIIYDESLLATETVIMGESLNLNYQIKYDAEYDPNNIFEKQDVHFTIELDNYKFTGDNSAVLADKISNIEYFVDNKDEATTFENALNKNVTKIKGIISNLKSEEKLDYIVNAVVMNSTNSSTKIEVENNESSSNIKVTPFKSKADIYIANSDDDLINDDITIRAEDTNITTLVIYPKVSSPSYKIDKVNSGLSGKVDVTLNIELPEGVTYVENEDYQAPTSIQNNVITYKFKNENLNEIITALYIDVSYDISISDNTRLEFISKIEATDSVYLNIKDLSTEEERTSKRIITYLSGANVIARVTSNKNSILKNGSFEISLNLINSTNETKNTSLLIKLPQSMDSYNLSEIENALCTTDLIGNDNVNWENCDYYKSNNYYDVKAIKFNYELGSKTKQNSKFKVNTFNNKTGDKYEFEPILYQSESDTTGKVLNKIIVNVTGLKISGKVWEDFNENGIMEISEEKISDVKLNLYDAESDKFITYTTPNANGEYIFADFNVGNYYITAEYDENKYSYTETIPTITDKSVISSFDNNNGVIRTNNINVDGSVMNIKDYNLGLILKKIYKVELNKTITKIEVTNSLGLTTVKDMNNAKLAKLDIKDMNNTKIKVIYNIEIINTGSYPGYVYRIKDYIPYGMQFNPNYSENKNWYQSSSEYIEYQGLYNTNTLLKPGVKHNISLALDIATREAGSFLNYVLIEEEDLKILGGKEDE